MRRVFALDTGARLAIPPRAPVRASDGAVFEGAAVVRLSVIDPTMLSALAKMPGAFRGVLLAAATTADGAPSDSVQLATLSTAALALVVAIERPRDGYT